MHDENAKYCFYKRLQMCLRVYILDFKPFACNKRKKRNGKQEKVKNTDRFRET